MARSRQLASCPVVGRMATDAAIVSMTSSSRPTASDVHNALISLGIVPR